MPFLSFPEAPTYTWSEQSVPLTPQVLATAAHHTSFTILQHRVGIRLYVQTVVCMCTNTIEANIAAGVLWLVFHDPVLHLIFALTMQLSCTTSLSQTGEHTQVKQLDCRVLPVHITHFHKSSVCLCPWQPVGIWHCFCLHTCCMSCHSTVGMSGLPCLQPIEDSQPLKHNPNAQSLMNMIDCWHAARYLTRCAPGLSQCCA